MTSVSAGHIILTPTQPVGSGRPQRESNPGRSRERETEREREGRERESGIARQKREGERGGISISRIPLVLY